MVYLIVTPLGPAAPIPAKQVQGSMHGFLVLKSADGQTIAVGDLIQVAHGRQVRSRMIFRFRDGSVDDETTVFQQGQVFRLLSDRHIQKGPSFPTPLDLTVNVSASTATWKQTKDQTAEMKTEHVDIPDDLANGLVPLVLQSIAPTMAETKVSYLASNPKPRLIKFSFKYDGLDRFRLGGTTRTAKKYNIHIELGGVAGVVAPIIGKQPSDMQMWITDGEVPTVLKTVGALYEGGPIWTIEQTSAQWQH